ncbi:MAG: acyl carrier protein [bacterium]
MERQAVQEEIIRIATPFVKAPAMLQSVTESTSLIDDLKVNSARLVDIVLAFEDSFDIEIEDDEADKIRTIGQAIDMVLTKVN